MVRFLDFTLKVNDEYHCRTTVLIRIGRKVYSQFPMCLFPEWFQCLEYSYLNSSLEDRHTRSGNVWGDGPCPRTPPTDHQFLTGPLCFSGGVPPGKTGGVVFLGGV